MSRLVVSHTANVSGLCTTLRHRSRRNVERSSSSTPLRFFSFKDVGRNPLEHTDQPRNELREIKSLIQALSATNKRVEKEAILQAHPALRELLLL